MTAAHLHPSQASASVPPLEGGKDTVVPLYNETDLARSLAPYARLSQMQRWVKLRLVLTDLSVLWLCFLAGRLPLGVPGPDAPPIG